MKTNDLTYEEYLTNNVKGLVQVGWPEDLANSVVRLAGDAASEALYHCSEICLKNAPDDEGQVPDGMVLAQMHIVAIHILLQRVQHSLPRLLELGLAISAQDHAKIEELGAVAMENFKRKGLQ